MAAWARDSLRADRPAPPGTRRRPERRHTADPGRTTPFGTRRRPNTSPPSRTSIRRAPSSFRGPPGHLRRRTRRTGPRSAGARPPSPSPPSPRSRPRSARSEWTSPRGTRPRARRRARRELVSSRTPRLLAQRRARERPPQPLRRSFGIVGSARPTQRLDLERHASLAERSTREPLGVFRQRRQAAGSVPRRALRAAGARRPHPLRRASGIVGSARPPLRLALERHASLAERSTREPLGVFRQRRQGVGGVPRRDRSPRTSQQTRLLGQPIRVHGGFRTRRGNTRPPRGFGRTLVGRRRSWTRLGLIDERRRQALHEPLHRRFRGDPRPRVR